MNICTYLGHIPIISKPRGQESLRHLRSEVGRAVCCLPVLLFQYLCLLSVVCFVFIAVFVRFVFLCVLICKYVWKIDWWNDKSVDR